MHAIYVLLLFRKAQSSLIDAASVIAQANLLRTSIRGMAHNLNGLANCRRDMRDTCQRIEAYYELEKVEPLLKTDPNPVLYRRPAETDVVQPQAADDGSFRGYREKGISSIKNKASFGQGMSIEFRHVTFTYPGSRSKALDDVSLVIGQGEVCSAFTHRSILSLADLLPYNTVVLYRWLLRLREVYANRLGLPLARSR